MLMKNIQGIDFITLAGLIVKLINTTSNVNKLANIKYFISSGIQIGNRWWSWCIAITDKNIYNL